MDILFVITSAGVGLLLTGLWFFFSRPNQTCPHCQGQLVVDRLSTPGQRYVRSPRIYLCPSCQKRFIRGSDD